MFVYHTFVSTKRRSNEAARKKSEKMTTIKNISNDERKETLQAILKEAAEKSLSIVRIGQRSTNQNGEFLEVYTEEGDYAFTVDTNGGQPIVFER